MKTSRTSELHLKGTNREVLPVSTYHLFHINIPRKQVIFSISTLVKEEGELTVVFNL